MFLEEFHIIPHLNGKFDPNNSVTIGKDRSYYIINQPPPYPRPPSLIFNPNPLLCEVFFRQDSTDFFLKYNLLRKKDMTNDGRKKDKLIFPPFISPLVTISRGRYLFLEFPTISILSYSIVQITSKAKCMVLENVVQNTKYNDIKVALK